MSALPVVNHFLARAWREYVARTGTRFEYLGYTIDNEQVIVRITG